MLGPVFLILFVASVPGILATDNALDGSYPDVTSCLVGVPQNAEKAAEAKKSVKESCLNSLSLKSPDENIFCFKFCVLESKSIISKHVYADMNKLMAAYSNVTLDSKTLNRIYIERAEGRNYSVYATYASNELLELSGVPLEKVNWKYRIPDATEEMEKTVDNLKRRLETCTERVYILRKDFEDCPNIAPAHKSELQKMIDCIEEAINCSNG